MHQDRSITSPVIRPFLFNLSPTLIGLVARKASDYQVAPRGLTRQTQQRQVLYTWYPALYFQHPRGHQLFKFASRSSRLKLPQTHRAIIFHQQFPLQTSLQYECQLRRKCTRIPLVGLYLGYKCLNCSSAASNESAGSACSLAARYNMAMEGLRDLPCIQ